MFWPGVFFKSWMRNQKRARDAITSPSGLNWFGCPSRNCGTRRPLGIVLRGGFFQTQEFQKNGRRGGHGQVAAVDKCGAHW